jgi:Na+/H+ antiporter NhaD/arsenite permease-like protein
MVKIGRIQIRLLIIILVGISAFFLFNISTAAAAANAVTESRDPMVPFYWLIAIVGSCIAFTLTYVGWRKYKGEKKNKRKNKDANN